MRRLNRVLTLALALASPTLPASVALAQSPVRGGILTFSMAAEPPTYDCHASNTFATIQRVAPHYSTLLKFEDGKYPDIVGDAAQSWTISNDQRTYTFKLRPNIKFHDGTPLTAEDVKATYERIQNPPPGVLSARQQTLGKVDQITVVDPLTVSFHLSEIDASMMATFVSPWNCIYSAARLRTDPNYPARSVMGSGPFRFVEHVAGSHWVGVRNDNYFMPNQPYLDGFRAITMNAAATLNALEGGQILAEFRGFAPNERDRLVKSMGDKIRIMEMSWNEHMDVSFNPQRKPFDDPRVRRALSLAIDRWNGSKAMGRISILREVGGIMRPGSEYARTDEELESLPGFGRDMAKNRAEARRLLKEAGQENLTFTLTNRNIPPYVAIGVYMIDQWRQIGVKVDHQTVELSAWTNALNNANFDAIVDQYFDHADEPSTMLTKFLSQTKYAVSSTRFTDPELDRLFEEQGKQIYLTPRRKIVQAFEQRVMEQAYSVPILWWYRIVALNSRVNGWTMSPSHMIYQDLSTVWLTPQAQ